MAGYSYPGKELKLFSRAVNWKNYWSSIIKPYVFGRVLDVGAGLGENVNHLGHPSVTEWCFLEPDEQLLSQLRVCAVRQRMPFRHRFLAGTIRDLPADEVFETVLFIDVIEHIHNDAAELERATDHLSPGGHLIVISPALPALFSDFDASIGHLRRYTRQSLTAIVPSHLDQVVVGFIDSVGIIASLANRFLLRNAMPTPSQIQLWDRLMIPLSRRIDRILSFMYGKTVYGIWKCRP